MHVLAFSLQKMQCSRKIASSNITIGMKVASQFHVFLQSCKSSYNIVKVIHDTYLYFFTKYTGKKIFDLPFRKYWNFSLTLKYFIMFTEFRSELNYRKSLILHLRNKMQRPVTFECKFFNLAASIYNGSQT